MDDLVERIVEINRRVWDEWPVGIDAGNVEEVRRAAATAVAADLKAEASKGELLREALTTALALIDDYLAYRHDGDPWSEDARLMGEMDINYAAKDGRLDAIRALMPEAPVREGWQPIETAPKGDPLRSILIATRGYVGGVVQVSWSETFWDFVDQDEDTYPDATHWMPLPAPPQDNREG